MSKIRLFGTSSGYVEIAPAAAASNNTLTAPSTVGEIIAKDAAGAIGVTAVHTRNIVATGTTKVGAAVTISESGIEASGIGITCANINGGQISGRRNLVINGAMNIAQRGTSSTSEGYKTIDRFETLHGNTDEAPTYSQQDVDTNVTPYTLGFRKAFRITNGNNTSGAGANDYILLRQKIEAQDIANSGWNYKSASSFVTLSFWIRSSVAQSFQGYLRTADGTSQVYPFETGSLSADTWTKVVKTVPGNSNITVNNDTGNGLQIVFSAFLGTDYTSNSVTEDAWQAYASSARVKDNTTTWYTTNDATLEVTGLQLEVGSQASAFEHRTFGDEFTLCQRYFQKYACTDQEWIYVEGNGTTYKWWQSHFNPMRSTPTVDVSGLSTGSGTSFAGGNGEVSSIAVTSTSQGNASGRVSYRVTGSASWGTARTLHHTDVWDGEFVTCSSEL